MRMFNAGVLKLLSLCILVETRCAIMYPQNFVVQVTKLKHYWLWTKDFYLFCMKYLHGTFKTSLVWGIHQLSHPSPVSEFQAPSWIAAVSCSTVTGMVSPAGVSCYILQRKPSCSAWTRYVHWISAAHGIVGPLVQEKRIFNGHREHPYLMSNDAVMLLSWGLALLNI